MRVSIGFRLPEEEHEMRCAIHAAELALALRDIKAHIRARLKHGDPSPETREELEALDLVIRESIGDLHEVIG